MGKHSSNKTCSFEDPHFRGSPTEMHREDMWHWLFDCLASSENTYIPYSLTLLLNSAAGIFYLAYLHRSPMPWATLSPRVAFKPCGRRSSHWPLSHRTEHFTPHKHGMLCFALLNTIYHHCFRKLKELHFSTNQGFYINKYIWLTVKWDACTSELQWQYT